MKVKHYCPLSELLSRPRWSVLPPDLDRLRHVAAPHRYERDRDLLIDVASQVGKLDLLAFQSDARRTLYDETEARAVRMLDVQTPFCRIDLHNSARQSLR